MCRLACVRVFWVRKGGGPLQVPLSTIYVLCTFHVPLSTVYVLCTFQREKVDSMEPHDIRECTFHPRIGNAEDVLLQTQAARLAETEEERYATDRGAHVICNEAFVSGWGGVGWGGGLRAKCVPDRVVLLL